MITIEQTVDIPADRHLQLDMTLPESVPGGRTRVALAFSPGCLKDVFPEDGLEYQRKMRDEWPD
jgi:hypothetical protein